MNESLGLTAYALARVLAHLSEDNYPTHDLLMGAGVAPSVDLSAYHGRAAARVIVRRRLAAAEMAAFTLWREAKEQ